MRVKQFFFDRLTGRLGDWVGRSHIVRVGQFLCRSGRIDAADGIATNGERQVQQALARRVSGVATVVDCGANRGEWSAEMVSAFRHHCRAGTATLRLYCFEPAQYTFQRLVENLAHQACNRVSLHPVQQALSRRDGTATLHVAHEGAGTNSLTAAAEHRTTEEVQVTTLAKFVRQFQLERIDLLKIDAEGHDFEVLVGASELIETRVIDVIQFEYNQRWIDGGFFLRDAFQLLSDSDYEIGKVTPRGIQWHEAYDWRLETFVQGNWLACLPRLVSSFQPAPGWLREGPG